AALLTLWVGPVLVHRISPRKLILIGTGLIALCYVGFSVVTQQGAVGGVLEVFGGSWSYQLLLFYGIWLFFVVGYIFSGPIPHQVIISQWFRKKRGMAMGVAYVGVGAIGALTIPYVAQPLTATFEYTTALLYMAPMVLITWPLVIFVMKDKPADVGQYPDGDPASEAITKIKPAPFSEIMRKRSFWLLVIGSFASIGAIGAIFANMKFILEDQGFVEQALRDDAHAEMNKIILFASIGGRVIMGWMADRYPKKYVMTATYFLVALSIPLLLQVSPDNMSSLYIFAVIFGFGMGADYMLIPLMAAEQFGVNSLARAMAIILPTDTIGQTWFPFVVALVAEGRGSVSDPDYAAALILVFAVAMIGAVAIGLLPKHGREDEALEKA
ncbi:MAG: MFS transporter, partial [bacterium]|nr:MFS transporter [bacterium]